MESDPVLAWKILPASLAEGRDHPHVFKVEGGLHYIQGNSAPYFTLTCTEHRQGFPNQEYSGGAGHDVILQHFPQFADLAALHLADIDGAPMHAIANARYFAGETSYIYGSTVKRDRAALQCHLRCVDNSVDNLLCNADRGDWTQFDADVEAMRPRWKIEARACIVKHDLTLYGDEWAGDPSDYGLVRFILGKSNTPEAEQTYIQQWGITSTAAATDRNPNVDEGTGVMNHWRVTLKRGRHKTTVYFSKGAGHNGAEPTAQEVIDCIAQDAVSVNGMQGFDNWAREFGYDTDSHKAHRAYMVCQRQAERLQKFLGEDHYNELMGGE